MDEMVKRRVTGAAVLGLVAAVVLPLLFGNPKDPRSSIRASFSGTPLPGLSPVPSPGRDSRLTSLPQNEQRPTRAVATARPAPQATVRPTPQPTPRRTAEPTPRPTPASGWVLQLASYGDLKSAQAFQARLEKDGYQAYRESVQISGKTYYRVRMGLSMSREEAAALQKTVEKRYRLQAQLLPAR